MAKKTSKRFSISYSGGLKNIAKNALLTLGGMFIASKIADKVQKKDVSGEDLLGLDGNASKFATPAILMATGLAGMTMVKSDAVKGLATGVLLAGGAKAVNAVAGKQVVALGNADDEQQVLIPGVGEVALPASTDRKVTYDELPSANEMATQYHEGIGADDEYEYVEGFEGDEDEYVEGVDDELLGIDGDEEELL